LIRQRNRVTTLASEIRIADEVSPMSFHRAERVEIADVKKGGESALEARGEELEHEQEGSSLPHVQTLLTDLGESSKQKAWVSDDQVDAAKAWMSKYALLQVGTSHETKAPQGQVAVTLRKAEKEQDGADAMFAEARAIVQDARRKSMLQSTKKPAGPPPPSGFKANKGNAASGGVLVMLENLIDDSQAMIDEAIQGETDAMTSYESFVQDSNEATEERKRATVDLRAQLGKQEGFHIEAKQDLEETYEEKAALRQWDIDLHGPEDCGYLTKNFHSRQQARTEEIDGMKVALTTMENMIGGQKDPKKIKKDAMNDKFNAIEAAGGEDTIEAALMSPDELESDEGGPVGPANAEPVEGGVLVKGQGEGQVAIVKMGGVEKAVGR